MIFLNSLSLLLMSIPHSRMLRVLFSRVQLSLYRSFDLPQLTTFTTSYWTFHTLTDMTLDSMIIMD